MADFRVSGINLGGHEVVLDYQQIRYVAKNGKTAAAGATGAVDNPFSTIQEAIDSITDASTSKRYCVKVAPGRYAENITMKSYVDVVGDVGPDQMLPYQVQIYVNGGDGTPLVTFNEGNTFLRNVRVWRLNSTAPGLCVYAPPSGKVSLNNVIVSNQVSGVNGGPGILAEIDATSIIAGIQLESCTIASQGGDAVKITKTGNKEAGSLELYGLNRLTCTTGALDINAPWDCSVYVRGDHSFTRSKVKCSLSPVKVLTTTATGGVDFVEGETVTAAPSGAEGVVRGWRKGTTNELLVQQRYGASFTASDVVTGATSGASETVSAVVQRGGMTQYNIPAFRNNPSPTVFRVGQNETFTEIQDVIDSISDANSSTKPYTIEVYKKVNSSGAWDDYNPIILKDGITVIGMDEGVFIQATAAAPAVKMVGGGSSHAVLKNIGVRETAASVSPIIHCTGGNLYTDGCLIQNNTRTSVLVANTAKYYDGVLSPMHHSVPCPSSIENDAGTIGVDVAWGGIGYLIKTTISGTGTEPVKAVSGATLQMVDCQFDLKSSDLSGTVTIIGSNHRTYGLKGTDVASANDMALTNGNYFEITGNTEIRGIATGGWTVGSEVVLKFNADPTVKHNTAASAGYASILLSGAADFAASADDTLTLVFDGTYWREIARAVI